MIIEIPVQCQNGHKATWIIEINGLNVEQKGVSESEKCSCPKWSFGEGYVACGKPVISQENKEAKNITSPNK